MRRSKLLLFLTLVATALSGAFVFGGTGAGADTATPEIDDEGWFARSVPPPPTVPVPCVPPGTPIPPQGCGPTNPTAVPTPQSKGTGHYVVASAGGTAGDDSATSGDTGWAAFKWDLSEQIGATVEKFVVKLTQGVDNNGRNQGDTWKAGDALLPIQACNILEFWAASQGANPWDARPNDSKQCIIPTVSGSTYNFDVTSFAQSWLDGTGYGFVIMPGTPDKSTGLDPFQITFSGYYDTTATAVKPQVDFQFTPASDDSFGGGFDDFTGGGDEFFEEISISPEEGILQAVPDIDVLPDDVGSEPLPEDVAADAAGQTELAGPTTGGRPARPISTDTTFPWAVLFLLPVVALAFWSTGTALGPIGDPVPARRGGVSRVLAQRQAAPGGSDLHTRNR